MQPICSVLFMLSQWLDGMNIHERRVVFPRPRYHLTRSKSSQYQPSMIITKKESASGPEEPWEAHGDDCAESDMLHTVGMSQEVH